MAPWLGLREPRRRLENGVLGVPLLRRSSQAGEKIGADTELEERTGNLETSYSISR